MNRLWPDGVSEEVGWFKEGQTHTRRLTRAHKEHCFGKWEESWGGAWVLSELIYLMQNKSTQR